MWSALTKQLVQGELQPDTLSLSWADAWKQNMNSRDFTVNAIMYDPFSHLLLDYNGGLADCAKKKLRCCKDPVVSFTEDPARMLRAVRLSSRAGSLFLLASCMPPPDTAHKRSSGCHGCTMLHCFDAVCLHCVMLACCQKCLPASHPVFCCHTIVSGACHYHCDEQCCQRCQAALPTACSSCHRYQA